MTPEGAQAKIEEMLKSGELSQQRYEQAKQYVDYLAKTFK